jgi:hypothetical protein
MALFCNHFNDVDNKSNNSGLNGNPLKKLPLGDRKNFVLLRSFFNLIYTKKIAIIFV